MSHLGVKQEPFVRLFLKFFERLCRSALKELYGTTTVTVRDFIFLPWGLSHTVAVSICATRGYMRAQQKRWEMRKCICPLSGISISRYQAFYPGLSRAHPVKGGGVLTLSQLELEPAPSLSSPLLQMGSQTPLSISLGGTKWAF